MARVRPEAVGHDWSSSVVRAVGFQKGGPLTAEEARSKSNQSSQTTSLSEAVLDSGREVSGRFCH